MADLIGQVQQLQGQLIAEGVIDDQFIQLQVRASLPLYSLGDFIAWPHHRVSGAIEPRDLLKESLRI